MRSLSARQPRTRYNFPQFLKCNVATSWRILEAATVVVAAVRALGGVFLPRFPCRPAQGTMTGWVRRCGTTIKVCNISIRGRRQYYCSCISRYLTQYNILCTTGNIKIQSGPWWHTVCAYRWRTKFS